MFLGILILLNTFASDIIFVIALPLIIFWRKQTSNTKATDGKSHNSSSGEFEYHEKPMKLRADIFRVCALYQVSKGFKVGYFWILRIYRLANSIRND